jgi:hypothetical protein
LAQDQNVKLKINEGMGHFQEQGSSCVGPKCCCGYEIRQCNLQLFEAIIIDWGKQFQPLIGEIVYWLIHFKAKSELSSSFSVESSNSSNNFLIDLS